MLRKIKKLLLGITMVLAVLSFVFAAFIPHCATPRYWAQSLLNSIVILITLRFYSPGNEDLRQLKADLEQVHPATIYGLPGDMEAAFVEAENKATRK